MTGGLWITTDTEEIDRLAADLDDAGVQAGAALLDLLVARGRVLAVAETPDGARGRALVALEVAIGRVRDVQDRATERAGSLRSAARGYDGAESQPLVDLGWTALPPTLTGPAALGIVLGRILLGLGGDGPLLPASTVATVVGIVPLDALAALTQVVAPRLPYDPEAVRAEIRLLDAGEPLAPGAAASLTDVADRVRLANEAAGDGVAVVDVQRIEHVDGTVSWTVSVHGTKDGPIDLFQPFSVTGNVGAYLGTTSPGEDMVLAAMEEAGIPPGEQVLLAGHSQGGMAMTRLATSSAVRDRFSIAGVVTFGSPVAHMPSTGVPTMNVQHAEDGVASLSGAPGAREAGAAPGEVVAVRELSGDPSAAIGGADAHGMDNYVETSEQILAAGNPATQAWEEAVRPLLAEDGATVTATTYRGTRTLEAVTERPFG